MSTFLASMSPSAHLARYLRSSSAFRGRGKLPPSSETRRGKQRLLRISRIHAENISAPPFHTAVLSSTLFRRGTSYERAVPAGRALHRRRSVV